MFLSSQVRRRDADATVAWTFLSKRSLLGGTPTVQWCDGIPAVALAHSWLGQFCPSVAGGVDADATVAWTVLSKRSSSAGTPTLQWLGQS